jgi:hypothetical protein
MERDRSNDKLDTKKKHDNDKLDNKKKHDKLKKSNENIVTPNTGNKES